MEWVGAIIFFAVWYVVGWNIARLERRITKLEQFKRWHEAEQEMQDMEMDETPQLTLMK